MRLFRRWPDKSRAVGHAASCWSVGVFSAIAHSGQQALFHETQRFQQLFRQLANAFVSWRTSGDDWRGDTQCCGQHAQGRALLVSACIPQPFRLRKKVKLSILQP